ncbi:alpha/beta hydrolase-fold protein [Candidatus Soleaferrea massiliensis]|uniref:alpha/beta hydrolase-fold protein n=1 Tax=Candidatus Soleaferrea massiliensis TaxID=1470354 RepID=UPI00058AC832|nr:alpha/beta hydrolase-fold protein [Candidatus Soleaferrea massiliensis]
MRNNGKKLLSVLLAVLMLLSIVPSFALADGRTDYTEGVTVKKDADSPTGYTATFVYKNADAKDVKIFSDLFGFYREENGTYVKYSPHEWERDMFPMNLDEAGYTEGMKNVGNGTWVLTMPLPSGGFSYRYVVDGIHMTDPANKPLTNTITGKEANFSMVYLPFDSSKQDIDRSIELPRKGQNGTVVFDSYKEDEHDRPLAIYLPYGYDENRAQPYKVIYIAHGSGGNELDWMNDGCVPNIMDNLVAENKAEPAVVVSMDYSEVKDSVQNQMENIMPYINANYNVSKEVADTAYCGLSAGGTLAGEIYLAHPKAFGYFGIWSSARVASMDLEGIDGLDEPTIMLGMGAQDRRLGSMNTFAEKLTAKGIDYSYDVRSGAHDWEFWPQMFTAFAKNVLWKDNAGYTEGVTVKEDAGSPTGYTATFVYKNTDAKDVKIFSDLFGFYREENGVYVKYSPYEWEKDMFPMNLDEKGYTEDMINVGDGTWVLTMPLPSGGFSYRYIVDGVSTTDPANKPLVNTITGREANFSMVYLPFDSSKQDVDRSVELPRNGQNGTVVFDSYKEGENDRELAVYLPYGYDENRAQPYKVIYISHGSGGSELDWMNDGCLPNIMDNLVAEGKTEPAVVVAMNNSEVADSTQNQMDNIKPYIEKHYNVSNNVDEMAYCGLSLGGTMTARLYLAHPAAYGYFGIWSSAQVASMDLEGIEGLNVPTVMLGMGAQDRRLKSMNAFAEKLTAKGVQYSYDVRNGAHDWEFWPQMFTAFAENVLWTSDASAWRSSLRDLYNEYRELEKGSYTNESWQVFQNALEAAGMVLDNTQASAEQLKAAYDELKAAFGALEETDASSRPGDSSSSGASGGGSQTGSQSGSSQSAGGNANTGDVFPMVAISAVMLLAFVAALILAGRKKQEL